MKRSKNEKKKKRMKEIKIGRWQDNTKNVQFKRNYYKLEKQKI